MASSNLPINPADDKVLLDAWAELAVYDRTASEQKNFCIRRRAQVIMLTLIATIASVTTGILQHPELATTFAVASFTIPLIGFALMDDIRQFTGTTSWIKYRYIAELMRMQIYLYRMKAGPYAVLKPAELDNQLATMISQAHDEVSNDGMLPTHIRLPQTIQDIQQAMKAANLYTRDTGFGPLEIEDYIAYRLESSRNWYDDKVLEDFARLKLSQRVAKAIVLAGSLIALAGLTQENVHAVALVAVTSAISFSLALISDVRMIGKTYNIYQLASKQLANAQLDWKAHANDPEFSDPQKKAARSAEFAQRIENILLWERKEWYEMALQAQTKGDETILGDLDRLRQRAEKEAKTSE